MKSRLVCLFLCMTLLLSMSTSVYASEIEDNNEYAEEEYTMEGTLSRLRWSNVASAASGMSVSRANYNKLLQKTTLSAFRMSILSLKKILKLCFRSC